MIRILFRIISHYNKKPTDFHPFTYIVEPTHVEANTIY
jgi:hypothetical protein